MFCDSFCLFNKNIIYGEQGLKGIGLVSENFVVESTDIKDNWNGHGKLNLDYYSEGEIYQWVLEHRYVMDSEIKVNKGTIFLIR